MKDFFTVLFVFSFLIPFIMPMFMFTEILDGEKITKTEILILLIGTLWFLLVCVLIFVFCPEFFNC